MTISNYISSSSLLPPPSLPPQEQQLAWSEDVLDMMQQNDEARTERLKR